MVREASNASLRVFMVSFPAQGHVNPLLRLGNCLASMGLSIIFSTTESFGEMMKKSNNISDQPIPVGKNNGSIKFEFFDDGWDYKAGLIQHPELFKHNLELVGTEKLSKMLKKHEEQGHPIGCVINNPFIPWASEVAETLGIPSAVLWVQSCACFSAYYHYQHALVTFPTEEEPELDVKLPCMPVLKHDEVPSFLHPSSPHGSFAKAILGQFKNLSKTSYILMDTFNELEQELIHYMSKLCKVMPIGPLFKYSTVSCANVRGDIMKADNCIEWLDLKPPSSVVYISFGTIVHLKQEQINEIAFGLLSSHVSFLWVIKNIPEEEGSGKETNVLPKGFLEEVGDKGKVVQWSPQERVLAHPSIVCFLTHCGWNSTIEALANGVPLVAFPQWGDQVTNAKYLVDELNVGIRLCRGEAENRIILRHEVDKCLREVTSGPKAVEIKENVSKWRKKAEESVGNGGSSMRNMQSFVNEISCWVSR